MLQTAGIDPNKHVINAGVVDAALVEDEQLENPVQANPIEADVGNIEEDTDPNSGDNVDAREIWFLSAS